MSPGIDSKESIPQAYVARARIYKRLRSPGVIPTASLCDLTESIPGLLKRLKIRANSYSVPSPHRLFKDSSTASCCKELLVQTAQRELGLS
jgi:hypothetical protein